MKFLLNDWSDPQRFNATIADRVLFLTLQSKAYRLQVVNNQVSSSTEGNLYTDQEEADTKMFLCCQHAVQQFSCEGICISAVDSDVGILAIYTKNG